MTDSGLPRALAFGPEATAHNDYGNALRAQQRPGEALNHYDRAVSLRPDYFVAHYNRGNLLLDLGRLDEALGSYGRALELRPDFAEAYVNCSIVLRRLGRPGDALESCRRALGLRPEFPEAHNNCGVVLQGLGRLDEALDSFGRALAVRPDYAEAHNNRAAVLRTTERFDEALEGCDRALALAPHFGEAHNNRGLALHGLRRHEEALESYERALKLEPGFAEAWYNRGLALNALRRSDQALESYERALRLKPTLAEAHKERGNALQQQQRFEEALGCYRQAIALRPDYAEAWSNQGEALRGLKRLEEACESYRQALRIDPAQPWLRGAWLHVAMQLCDWRDFEGRLAELLAEVAALKKVSQPFPLLALTDSPDLQRRAAQIWVSASYPEGTALPPLERRASGGDGRIRIGYYSADFHGHATAYLAARLFEAHDRARFRVVALSFGPEAHDDMRARLQKGFDQFVEVHTRSDREVAELSRTLGIDIAVDLKGFTHDERLGIFCQRAAPIQVSYLGYPGTSGAACIDYLIADRTLVPGEQRAYYSEKLVYLPHSYQVNDRSRSIAQLEEDRAQLGLPPTGFVFCCFNSTYKITPETFDSWMRILKQVPGSVLWLFRSLEAAAVNLRKEAESRGVSADRLVFADYAPPAEHLARQRFADLFLDTLPCNAHTTASDALWAGLPVLTRCGQSFAGRVAASLLNAVGLPELIASSTAQYEALAVGLANDPERLAGLRQRLQRNRLVAPLFDTERFTRDLEDAYAQMFARYQAGADPADIYVSDRGPAGGRSETVTSGA